VLGDWDTFVGEIPVDRLKAFFRSNQEVMRTRRLECEKLNKTIEAIKMNNISYQKKWF
jgi:hypothetical protein